LLLGAASAVLVALASSFWGQGFLPAAAVGVSVLAAMFVSAVVGVTLPAVLHALKLDPKVAAGPVVLMIGDVAATAMYLSLANWWLI
jgi:magnesium transporter